MYIFLDEINYVSSLPQNNTTLYPLPYFHSNIFTLLFFTVIFGEYKNYADMILCGIVRTPKQRHGASTSKLTVLLPHPYFYACVFIHHVDCWVALVTN